MMPKGKITEEGITGLRARYDASKSERTTVREIWQDIERLVTPYRGRFYKEELSEHTIEWFKRQIFDSTAVEAASTLAASIHGALTSFTSQWFSLSFQSKELNADYESQVWLEDVTKAAYKALEESDFQLEISETYMDLVGFGTSVLIQEERNEHGSFDRLDFQSIPMKHAFFTTDTESKVLYFFRRYWWKPIQICDKFGDMAPDDMKELAKSDSDTTEKREVVFAVYPRADYRDINTSSKLAPEKRPYGSVYFMHSSGHQLSEEGGYYEMPAYVPKWRKTNDSMWGNSPAMLVLSDIKTLNDLVELTLSQLAKVVDPPSFVTERGLLSDLDLEPAGLSVIRSKEDYWQYQSTAKFEPGELRIERLQQSIRRAFMVDQLELKESPAMSATEANIRYELMQRLLGPTLGRLKSDLFDPLIERTVKILARAGQLPPMPPLVKQLKGQFDIEYTGPLAKAQRSQTAAAMEDWAMRISEIASQVGQIDPEAATQIMAVADWDKFVEELADIKGVPKSVLTDTMKRKFDQQQRKGQVENSGAAAAMQQEGEAAEALGAGKMKLEEAGIDPSQLQ